MLFAYGEDFHSENPNAPPITPALTKRIAGQDVAFTPFFWPDSEVEVLLRTPWPGGPCAYVLARGTTDPSWGSILPESPIWLLPVLVLLGAVLVAVGPLIARIRKLTLAVSKAAQTSYESEIVLGGDDEISELAAAFDAAGREIRAQLEEKSKREQALRDFIANTTHDVMVPLAVLQGHLTTLREGASVDNEKNTDVVVGAMNEAHYMASLVHNLAVVARLDAAEISLHRTPVDLGALAERVASRHRPIARLLDIEINVAEALSPIIVSADVTLLEQALSNLVWNAVRYNRAHGHVAIVAEIKGEGRFVVRVLDDGPGIAPEVMSRLLTRGARGDAARTRAPEGQGLGLFIALRAAELHGYTMTLRASEAGGLEVEIEGDAEIKR